MAALNNTRAEMNFAKRGYCVIKKDKNGVMHRVRFQEHKQPLRSGESVIKYFTNNNYGYVTVHVGAESYFFEEGSVKRFGGASFGGLKVDKDGNSVLVGL